MSFEVTMKYKQIIVKIGIVFLMALLAFTFFSRTIRNSMLPKVRVISPYSGTLNRSLMIYDYEYVSSDSGYIVSEGNWVVDEVYVEEGDTISEGDIIFSIDTDKFRAELLRLLAAAESLDNSLKDTDLSDEDRRVLELNSFAAWREYRILRDSFPSSGEITSEVSGRIISLNIERYDAIRAGQKLMEIESDESRQMLKFELTFEENSVYRDLNTIKLSFISGASQKTVKAAVTSKEKNDNSFSWYAEMPDELGEDDVVRYLELEKKSAEYNYIIPTSCIQSNFETGDFIYMAVEQNKGQSVSYTIQTVNINVLEKGEMYSAVDLFWGSQTNRIVQYATKPISYGSEVIIIGE